MQNTQDIHEKFLSEMKNTKGDTTLSMARTRMADAISIIKKRPKSLADLDIELYRVKTGRYVSYRLTDKLYPKHVSEFNSKPTPKEIADFVKEREKRVSHHVKF